MRCPVYQTPLNNILGSFDTAPLEPVSAGATALQIALEPAYCPIIEFDVHIFILSVHQISAHQRNRMGLYMLQFLHKIDYAIHGMLVPRAEHRIDTKFEIRISVSKFSKRSVSLHCFFKTPRRIAQGIVSPIKSVNGKLYGNNAFFTELQYLLSLGPNDIGEKAVCRIKHYSRSVVVVKNAAYFNKIVPKVNFSARESKPKEAAQGARNFLNFTECKFRCRIVRIPAPASEIETKGAMCVTSAGQKKSQVNWSGFPENLPHMSRRRVHNL